MYYGDTGLYNDEQRFWLARASRQAAKGWRFRHLENREVRFLRAVVIKVRAFLVARLDHKKPAARQVRERLSY